MRNDSRHPATRAWAASPGPVGDLIGRLPAATVRELGNRMTTLVTTLGGPEGLGSRESVELVADEIGSSPDRLWLAHAVLAADLPTDEEMAEALVRARLAGTWAALAPVLDRLALAERLRQVEVLVGGVTCDVHTTAESEFLSGIQRVVRETTSRWQQTRDVTFVGWTRDLTGLRRLRDDEHVRMFGARGQGAAQQGVPPFVVPWQTTHLWVEVITDLRRTGRLLAMAEHSRNTLGVLGYDSIPVTSSGTVSRGMTSHFARSMAAIRHADRVAMISAAAADEFRGVMGMGAGRRHPGPAVAAVPLAVSAPGTSPADVTEASTGLVMDGIPMVLVVGSHEPRKNHLAVLHAAELLWREGLTFNLVLVGAGTWNSSEYDTTLGAMVAAGRPVQSLRALPDRLLGAAYRLAHCTVFPSLNEGFGLPVAESLAVGTPVITSNFGSMRDILAPHGRALGGLLVDPRDDTSLAEALRAMIVEPDLHARLRAETAQHPLRSWDDYADDVWDYLVTGTRPTAGHGPADPQGQIT